MASFYLFFALLLPCVSLFYNDYDDIVYRTERNTIARRSLVSPMRGRTQNYDVPDTFAEWLRAKVKKKPKTKKIVTREYSTVPPSVMNYSATYYPAMENFQFGADKAKPGDYPWIALVIHSRTDNRPNLCTAACIEERIFITAARCLFSAQVLYLTVVYQDKRIPVNAYVLPTIKSKQWFDDIGFIIVNREFRGTWKSVKLYRDLTPLKRTDNNFLWFEKLGWLQGYALGYVTDPLHAPNDHTLYKMNAHIGIYLCNWLYGRGADNIKTDYFVPCYYSCTIKDYMLNTAVCAPHLSGEGHILIEKTTNELLGIATWEGLSARVRMPVGMSVVGSEQFLKDRQCAKLIRDKPDNGTYFGMC